MKNDKLGICLIGAGRAGMIHANNFMKRVPNACMKCVVDVVPETARSAAESLGISRYCVDYREILDSPGIDAVVVVSPTHLHREIVVACAGAGKHILCEKPMALNAQECEEMENAVARNNVKLQIGFMRRFDADFIRAKEIVDSGTIGEVVLIRSCTRGPSKPHPWMYDLKRSNGILAEVNSHDIDTIRWFADSEVKTVFAVAGNYRNREIAAEFPDYYDNIVVTGEFVNGIQYVIDGAAYMRYGYDVKLEIIGTFGTVRVSREEANRVQCVTPENGINTPFVKSWTDLFKDAYLEEDVQFVDCILNDKEPQVTGHDGKMAVQIVEAGNRSVAEKRIIEFTG